MDFLSLHITVFEFSIRLGDYKIEPRRHGDTEKEGLGDKGKGRREDSPCLSSPHLPVPFPSVSLCLHGFLFLLYHQLVKGSVTVCPEIPSAPRADFIPAIYESHDGPLVYTRSLQLFTSLVPFFKCYLSWHIAHCSISKNARIRLGVLC